MTVPPDPFAPSDTRRNTQNPRVTVALSVYDCETHLAAALESIRVQTFRDFECLIINDGSSDRSGEIADRFARTDSRFFVLHRENRGLVDALNMIVRESRGDLIARMDGDDIALPDRFAKQIAFLDAHSEIGALGTGCTTIDESGAVTDRVEEIVATAAIPSRLHEGSLLCHPSVMLRRDTLRTVGGYRGAYRHCEDYDLWLRLAEVTTLGNLPERLLLYRRSPTQVSARFALVQKYGAAVAWEAHIERRAGRPDPTEGLASLPPFAGLDALFGRVGVARAVRAKVALGILYSPGALRDTGFDLILEHVREGGARDGLWRTVARLMKFGAPFRAVRLAATLATT